MRHDTPEFSLIADALTGNRELTLCPDWDWDQTVAIAAREEVLPTLAGKLSCPPDLSDFFATIHELNAERNRQLIGEIETLALLLNQAGIEPVLLKGSAYLVTGVYCDPADRWLLKSFGGPVTIPMFRAPSLCCCIITLHWLKFTAFRWRSITVSAGVRAAPS